MMPASPIGQVATLDGPNILVVGTNASAISTDGVSYLNNTLSAFALRTCAFSPPTNRFAASLSDGSLHYTSNGFTFVACTTSTGSNVGGAAAVPFAVLSNGRIVVMGLSGGSSQNVAYSDDCAFYTVATVTALVGFPRVAVAVPSVGAVFFGSNTSGTTSRLATSANGVSFASKPNPPFFSGYNAACMAGGTLVVGGGTSNTSNTQIYTCGDMSSATPTYTNAFTTSGNVRGLAYSPTLGLTVCVTDTGNVYTSADLVTWTLRASGLGTLVNVAWSPQTGRFVAASNSGAVLYSTTGISWTSVSAATMFAVACK